MIKIESFLKCLPGAKVLASNYRTKSKTWEYGTVLDIETNIGNNGRIWNQYRVLLDRRSTSGNYVFLHVGDDSISPAK